MPYEKLAETEALDEYETTSTFMTGSRRYCLKYYIPL